MKRAHSGSPVQPRRKGPPLWSHPEDTQLEQEDTGPTISLPNEPKAEDYNNASRAHTAYVIRDWIPHALTPEEVRPLREQSEMRRSILLRLEDEYASTPKADTSLKKKLFIARITFWTPYFRLFRVSGLPPEILCNILRFVCWSAPEPASGIRWRLNITAVSRHWRSVALGDPTLWNAIWFRDGPNFERSLAWFDRSALAPTDLRINDTPACAINGRIMSSLLDKLFLKLSTIRMFIVVVESWEAAWTVLDRLRQAGDRGVDFKFERFELHRTGLPYAERNVDPDLRDPIPLFGGRRVESLVYISINGVNIDWKKTHLRNLTTLDLRRIPTERTPSVDRFRQFLKDSPGLIKLCLDGAGPQWSEPLKKAPILLPSLKIFILGDLSMVYAIHVVSQVKAPNLVDLTIMNFVGEDYSPFFTFLKNAFPALKIFTVYTMELRTPLQLVVPLIRFLQSTPELRMLKVGNLPKNFFDIFLVPMLPAGVTPTEGNTPERSVLAPKLEILECQSGDLDCITNFAVLRSQLGKPLSRVYLGGSVVNRVRAEQVATINSVSKCLRLDPGSRSPEEIQLLH